MVVRRRAGQGPMGRGDLPGRCGVAGRVDLPGGVGRADRQPRTGRRVRLAQLPSRVVGPAPTSGTAVNGSTRSWRLQPTAEPNAGRVPTIQVGRGAPMPRDRPGRTDLLGLRMDDWGGGDWWEPALPHVGDHRRDAGDARFAHPPRCCPQLAGGRMLRCAFPARCRHANHVGPATPG